MTVTCSAIQMCEEHIAHEILDIERQPQGKDELQSNWSQYRYRWVTQLLVRLDLEPDLTNFMEDGVIPPYFDKIIAQTTQLSRHCMVG